MILKSYIMCWDGARRKNLKRFNVTTISPHEVGDNNITDIALPFIWELPNVLDNDSGGSVVNAN